MSDSISNSKRIAKNSVLLYFRMLFMMLVSLYTSRVILNALGVEDYGIYNVVGGLVTMFSLINGSLSAAISRFITFELGTGNLAKLKRVFSSSVTIQAGIAIIIILIAETVGLWFLNCKMVIPPERVVAANWCYQFSLITFAISLISVPYNAAITAHEKMSAYAYISIAEAIGKLLIAWCISYNPFDKLVFYAAMIAALSWIIRLVYVFYCKRNFEECTYHFIYDHDLLKQMFGFAGWNFIGASSGVLRDQGTNVLFNLFFGPVVNASRGISMQVNSAVSGFANNFMMAIRPQITKSYAAKDYDYTFKLVFVGARVTYYMFLLISLPIIFEAPIILTLWLNVVPDYSVIFVRLILIYIMTESISYTMVTLMLATGNIKKYQIVVGGCQMLNLPLSYLLLKLGLGPEWAVITAITVALGCLGLRLKMLNEMISFPAIRFIKDVLISTFVVTIVSSMLPLVVVRTMDEGFLRLIITGVTCVVSTVFFVYFIGCSRDERQFINAKIINYWKSKTHK